MKILTFAACLGFAMPCYADSIQIGDPVTVPVTVTVSSVALCDFDAARCSDESVTAVVEGDGE